MAPSQDQPIYPNAPVALVVLAIEFPQVSISDEMTEELQRLLRPDFPLIDKQDQQRVVIQPGGPVRHEARVVPRYTTRDRAVAVLITTEHLVIETRQYDGLEDYLELVRKPVAAVVEALNPSAITSLGHRYIDEIRVPSNKGEQVQWEGWIDPSLLSMSLIPELAGLQRPTLWQSATTYRTSQESTMTLRFGPADGVAVPVEGATRRLGAERSGPFFLLDWDSTWTPEVPPEFTEAKVLEQCAELYAPVRSMFHHITSDRLRQIFKEQPEQSP